MSHMTGGQVLSEGCMASGRLEVKAVSSRGDGSSMEDFTQIEAKLRREWEFEQDDAATLDEQSPRTRAELASELDALGCRELLESFNEATVDGYLTSYSPKRLATYLKIASEEFDDILNLIRSIPEHRLDGIMKSGFFFVRGRDKENRPILWSDDSGLERMKLSPEEYVAFKAWVLMHATAMRPPGVWETTIVKFEKNRSNLGLNAAPFFQLIRHAIRMYTPNPGKQVWFVYPRRGTRILISIAMRIFPSSLLNNFHTIETEDGFEKLVDDMSCLPDWIDPQRGTPFEANLMTVGDYKRFIIQREPRFLKDVFGRTSPEYEERRERESRETSVTGELERNRTGSANDSAAKTSSFRCSGDFLD